jgi:DNA polymerase-3 subunit epsilon
MGTMAEQAAAIKDARTLLVDHEYRVLHPFRGGGRTYHRAHEATAAPLKVGVMIDTETTGPDVSRDQIIQLAAVPFTYRADSGAIVEVHAGLTMYEEPTVPITPEAAAVHGIGMERLAGHRFDEAALSVLMAQADLVLAHNAAFDRPMLDRRFRALPVRPWGCTYQDIPWRRAKYPSASLGALLIEHTEHYFAGHDAADDCYAALHCLAYPFAPWADATESDRWPLSHVLQRVAHPATRIFAVGAPFDTKDRLQQRGYRWNDPTKAGAAMPRAPKAWWREVSAGEHEAELAWLDAHIYYGTAALRMVAETVDPTTRFSRAA